MIVPTLRVGMHPVTLRVTTSRADAKRPSQHSHAERGNNQAYFFFFGFKYLVNPWNQITSAGLPLIWIDLS